MKNFTSCLLAIAILSCNNQASEKVATVQSDTASPAVENKIMIPSSVCYASYQGKDTVTLKTENFPNVVTGILRYNLYGKDRNKGEIDGVMHGDTLVADYRFQSEGAQSVRQVAFLLKDSTAIEGYGPMEEKDGKMIFKHLGGVDFSKGIKLRKVECPVE